MKNTLRYNPPKNWYIKKGYNAQWFGLTYACHWICEYFGLIKNVDGELNIKDNNGLSLLEIGSYKGESTSIFASSGLFKDIYCMEPFEGNEIALDELNDTWDQVKKEFFTNTRHWDNINLIQDFSFNQVDNFPDLLFDVIYIDASHTYEDIKEDIKMYLPKCKYIIGGHDYGDQYPGVKKAVDEIFESPDLLLCDGSWFKVVVP